MTRNDYQYRNGTTEADYEQDAREFDALPPSDAEVRRPMDEKPRTADDLKLASDDLLERKRVYNAEHLNRCERIHAPIAAGMYRDQLRAVEDEITLRWYQQEQASAARFDSIEGVYPPGAYR